MERNVLYRIRTYDAFSVTLIDLSTRHTIMIQRGQIASLETGWGELKLTTNAGVSYRVTRGLMPKQRAMVRAAFAR